MGIAIKVIILAIAALMIYKLVGGQLPSIRKSKTKKSKDKHIDNDTLVECVTCKTYVTAKDSFIVNGKYYCSKECIES